MICLYLSGKVGRFLSDNMTKHEIRKEIKAKRAMLDEAYIKNNSTAIFKKIKEMPYSPTDKCHTCRKHILMLFLNNWLKRISPTYFFNPTEQNCFYK